MIENEKDLKILYLTLKKEHFIDIYLGKKKVEYRWKKPYWDVRLANKKYDIVQFTNGYTVDRPTMRLEHVRTRLINGSSPLGNGEQYAVVLGDLLESWKCEQLVMDEFIEERVSKLKQS